MNKGLRITKCRGGSLKKENKEKNCEVNLPFTISVVSPSFAKPQLPLKTWQINQLLCPYWNKAKKKFDIVLKKWMTWWSASKLCNNVKKVVTLVLS